MELDHQNIIDDLRIDEKYDGKCFFINVGLFSHRNNKKCNNTSSFIISLEDEGLFSLFHLIFANLGEFQKKYLPNRVNNL